MSSKMIGLLFALGLIATIGACVDSKNTERTEYYAPQTEEIVAPEAGQDLKEAPEETEDNAN